MIYKKLFNIPYKNKKFTIFIDENNRRTFLEINDKGEYFYPKLEDFIVLNEIYNNRNPFIQNVIHKFTFKEKVLATISGGLVALDLFLVGALLGQKNTLNGAQSGPEEVYIEDVKELDKIFGYENVSIQAVHAAINSNESLDEEYKEIANNLIEELIKKYPDTDLRVFYERIKNFKVNKMDLEELQKEYNMPGSGGNNSATNNQMNIPIDASNATVAHEIAHCLNNFDNTINGIRITRYTSCGSSLAEAMNSDIASLVEDDVSYLKERSVLHFLQSCIPYEIDTHLNKGIWYLIEELKSNYPNQDIDFIVNSLDSMTDTLVNFGVYIPLDANISFLDELFDMCKENVSKNPDNIYEPFIAFSKMFKYTETENIYFTYLDKYNEHLKKLGYAKIITKEDIEPKLSVYKDASRFYIDDNRRVYPLLKKIDDNGFIKSYYIITEDGTEEIGLTFSGEISGYFMFDNLHLVESYIENKDTFGTSEYWKKIGLENKVILPYMIESTNITLNNQEYKKAYIPNMLISVGRDKNGNVAFRLTEDENIIYESAPNITDCSNEHDFRVYIGDFTGDSLELTDYLNSAYLKNWIIENYSGYNFENIYIINGEIKVYPKYQIRIKDGDEVYDFSVDDLFYYINSRFFYDSPVLFYDNFDITYREVFNYFNILDGSKEVYEFTKEKLEEIAIKYVEDRNRNITR